MLGIAGIVGGGPYKERRASLDVMVAGMMHEPFYGSGTCLNEASGLLAGIRAPRERECCERESAGHRLPGVGLVNANVQVMRV